MGANGAIKKLAVLICLGVTMAAMDPKITEDVLHSQAKAAAAEGLPAMCTKNRALKPGHTSGRVTDVKVIPNRRKVSQGDALYFQLRNAGSRSVYYGEPYMIDRYLDSKWELVAGGALSAWRRWLRRLPSGRKSPCQMFQSEAALDPGLYRVRKKLIVRRPGPDRRLWVAAKFGVAR